jgi:hypothetical protein
MLTIKMISKANSDRSHAVRRMKFLFVDMGVFERRCWKAWKREPIAPTIPTSTVAVSNTVEIPDIPPPHHCT